VKKKLVSLVLVATMALGLVACGKSNATTEPVESVVNTDTAALNIFMASEPAHLDPALNSSVDGGCLAVNSFEGLLRYDSEGNIEPACAESYEISEDGLTYTFTLRDGLKWSNGETLDASDFEYSWKRAASVELAADYGYLCDMFPGYNSANMDADGNPAPIVDEEVFNNAIKASEDGKTFTVTVNAVCPYFLDLCAFPFFFPVYEDSCVSTKTAEVPGGTWANDAGETFVSNGAFKLQSWNHDSDMTYVKNEYYWDADSVSIDTLNVMLTSEDTAAYTAYQSGSLDFIDTIPTAEMETAKQSSEYVLLNQLGNYYIEFNYNSDLYKNLGLDEEQAKVFRHALALLVDRQYIVDAIGQADQVPADSFVPAGCSDGNGGEFKTKGYYDLADYDANVAEAKELLASLDLYDTAAEKLTKDITLVYLTNNSEGNVKVAEAIASDLLSNVGINVKIEQQEWQVFQDTRKAGNFDIARGGWIMDYNDPINMLEMYTTNSGNNDCQFGRDTSKNLDWTKFDSLISSVRTESDLAKRAELMHEAEDMLFETWCVVPLYFYTDPYMVKDNVKGIYGTVEGMKYFYHATKTAE